MPQAQGAERRKSPPREGPALLQGLVVCGLCGRRMTVRYHTRKGRQCPEYVCQSEGIETATSKCQSIPGSGIDEAIGALLVETVTPITLKVSLQVQAELEARAGEADALRRQRVERARYEADFARRRFMEADPCPSRIFMQPSEDRHGGGRERLGIQQHCRVPLLVRNDRLASLDPRTGVFATDGSNPDTTT